MPTSDRILACAAQIVTAYVGANAVDATALPGLIQDIYRALTGLRAGTADEPPEPRRVELPMTLRPAVEIRKSVFADHLICLEDGQNLATLKRHLRTAHGLSPQQYRAKWNLPASYPMVAPDYAKVRSRMAKESGLGRRA